MLRVMIECYCLFICRTYVITDILIEGDAFTSEAEVAVMVSDNILGMPMVHRVGTTTDIPASKLP